MPDSSVADLSRALARDSFAVVPANVVWPILANFGAFDAEAESLHGLWDQAVPQQDEDGEPVYAHKGTLVTYYAMNTSDAEFNVRRSSSREATQIPGHSIEYIDPTTKHKASYYRVHRSWPAAADTNSVIVAAQRLVFALMANASAWHAPSEPPSGVYEAMMSAFRVRGDPGPEGVHQDDAELTVVMLVRRHNVARDSGASRVWSLDQPCGKPRADDAALPGRLLASTVLTERFDTLLVADRAVKHEVRPITTARAEAGEAERDVLTFEVRRPRGSSTHGATLT